MKDDQGCIGESMSAASPGSSVFNKMIKLLEEGKYDGIVAWPPNRLSCNMPDTARIVCGYSIMVETKKGHDYYHCTHKNKVIKCTQGSIRGEELDMQLDALLQQYSINDELYRWGLKALQELADKEQTERNMAQGSQYDTIQVLQKCLDNFLDLVSDGVITPVEYSSKKAEISKQLEGI